MPTCDQCGEFVTPDFIRVFSDNDGELPGCPACTTTADRLRSPAGP